MVEDETTGSPGVPAAKPLVPADRVGRYVIVAKLGQGGMGVVYSAYDDELDRAVAIKLLHPQGSTTDARSRLVREARALAKLSHPNVVAVHDAQTVGDAVYVAMELVDGADLRAWRAERARSTEEILDVFVQAGRGLAAAHAQGIVHRDFKPANVLVGRDGRVRVADFGLAVRTTPDGGTHERAGTPAYMSPEQHRGEPVTAASDQFSFCVALAEALSGERPFSAEALAAGEPPPPELPGVVSRLRPVVERGLAIDPERRFPSMSELVDALARDPGARRRRFLWAGIAALLVSVTGAALLARRDGGAPVCGDATGRLEGVWDAPMRERVERAFLATNAPFAGTAWINAADAMDRYAARWTEAHTEACEATRVRGEQPEHVLALRMACLDRRRQSLAATVNLFAVADATVVENAVRATASLPALDGCADVATLLARVPPPDDRRVREQIDALRGRLAEAEALLGAGKYEQGLALVGDVIAQARPLHHAPLLAEAEALRGWLLVESGDDGKAAEQALYEAIFAAEAGRHEDVVAHAWIDLVWVIGVRQRRPDETERIGRLADAALKKLGDPPLLRARYWQHLAGSAAHQRRFDEMDELNARALAAYELAQAPLHPDLLDTRFNIAAAAFRRGKAAEALPPFQELLPLYVQVYGADHPHTARCHAFLGNVLAALGRHAEAIEELGHALELRMRVVGPDHRDVGTVWKALSESLARLGRLSEAQHAAARAAEIRALRP